MGHTSGVGAGGLDWGMVSAVRDGEYALGLGLYRLRGYVEVERIKVPVGEGETIDVVKMVKEA